MVIIKSMTHLKRVGALRAKARETKWNKKCTAIDHRWAEHCKKREDKWNRVPERLDDGKNRCLDEF